MQASDLKVQLFADGADLASIAELVSKPWIRGFTTNPSLARKAGIRDYFEFAQAVGQLVGDRPLSLEVVADEFDEMERQALRLAALPANVFVKIPITNTRGEDACPLIQRLVQQGVRVNVTAVFTMTQVLAALYALESFHNNYISIFAGRIADTGVNPLPIVAEAVKLCPHNVQIIWASPREIYNVIEANRVGCHVITIFPEILNKLHLLGRDLTEFSLDTVKMFYDDACKAKYVL